MIQKVLAYVVALLIWEFLKKKGYINKLFSNVKLPFGANPEPVPPIKITGGID